MMGSFPFLLLRRIKRHTLDILAPHLQVLDLTWTVGMLPSLCPLEYSLHEDCR